MSDTLEIVTAVMVGGTAIGTLALAVATFKLARGTGDQLDVLRKQAAAAEEQTETAAAALVAQVRPLLIDVPTSGDGDDEPPLYPTGERGVKWKPGYAEVSYDAGRGFVSVPLRNIGPGPASIDGARFFVAGVDVPADDWIATKQYVPSGEVARVSCVFGSASRHLLGEFVDAVRQRGHGISIEVEYLDVSGRLRTRGRYDLARRIDEGWIVSRIEHRLPEAGPAIAELRGTARGSSGATGVLTTAADLQGSAHGMGDASGDLTAGT